MLPKLPGPQGTHDIISVSGLHYLLVCSVILQLLSPSRSVMVTGWLPVGVIRSHKRKQKQGKQRKQKLCKLTPIKEPSHKFHEQIHLTSSCKGSQKMQFLKAALLILNNVEILLMRREGRMTWVDKQQSRYLDNWSQSWYQLLGNYFRKAIPVSEIQ